MKVISRASKPEGLGTSTRAHWVLQAPGLWRRNGERQLKWVLFQMWKGFQSEEGASSIC